MVFPDSFEKKVGFDDIRRLLKSKCISSSGKEKVDELSFSCNAEYVRRWHLEIEEFMQLRSTGSVTCVQYFPDLQQSVLRLNISGTHLDEKELYDLRRCLITSQLYINAIDPQIYPTLRLLTKEVNTFPELIKCIDLIIDSCGNIQDNASSTLASIKREIVKAENSVSHVLNNVLNNAKTSNLIDKDATPTLRDGRLVVPVPHGNRRKIKGIIHDESDTGKTVFIEPEAIIEINNCIRELVLEQKREILRILNAMADNIRPNVKGVVATLDFLAYMDLLQAKVSFAEEISARPQSPFDIPFLDWVGAINPLLQSSLMKMEKKMMPLDITLTNEKHLLIISGPNAGGKSVCLKTVGLLQYMLQCGLPIPVGERSKTGIFKSIMIDIGDPQSMENELSTYSGHLANMKYMMRYSNASTLILIDELGNGTEPVVGGAIAEAVLAQLCRNKTWGIITTHYHNLKRFANETSGVTNASMLYDRQNMRPLFQLSIGQPGSSFAIDMAHKVGLGKEVISYASQIAGQEYLQSDKYLQDIARDKRYWEGKRQEIHKKEKELQQKIDTYSTRLSSIESERKEILKQAKEEAKELLKESNRKIENTIREIKESLADKEKTKQARKNLVIYMQEITTTDKERVPHASVSKYKKRNKYSKQASHNMQNHNPLLTVGDKVCIKGGHTVGKIEQIEGAKAIVVFGDIHTKTKIDNLERTENPLTEKHNISQKYAETTNTIGSQSKQITRELIESHKENFQQDIDIRGMRGDEAINTVMHFIDDAILLGAKRVRILHGTGTGVLRQLIREYLQTVQNIEAFYDEHVQFGGAGITVVDIER